MKEGSLRSQESSASNGARFGFETKKLWPFEDELRKAKAEIFLFRSQAPISKGVSQMRNHPLAHECHFAAPPPHFKAAKWAAKMSPPCKDAPWLRNGLQATNQVANHLQVAESSPSCEITFNLQNQSSNLENGQFNLRNPPVQSQIFATD